MTDIFATAAELVDHAHAGQLDKAGQPYTGHLYRVAGYAGPDDTLRTAALLHDTLEDTDTSRAELSARGIPDTVLDIVELLTRRPDVPDDVYYQRIRNHPEALQVKLADLADNTDPRRLAVLPADTRERLLRKYRAAYAALGAGPSDGDRRRGTPSPAPAES
jgi:(p)ppGpp synthase/HD superfamily hydrolase